MRLITTATTTTTSPSSESPATSILTTRRTMLRLSAGALTLIVGQPGIRVLATQSATPAPAHALPATSYAMDARIDLATSMITGTSTIVWSNATGQPQDTLHLRLYPNAAYYPDGATVLGPVRVDDKLTEATIRDGDPTVWSVALGRAANPGDTVRLDLGFTTRMPAGASGSFGILGQDPTRGSWALADWYPILAGWEPERAAWYLDPPTPFGDPTFPETATYRLSLTIPDTFTLVSSGGFGIPDQAASPSTPAITGLAEKTLQIQTGPIREFAMALLPDTSQADGDLRVSTAGVPTDATPAPIAATPAGDASSDPAVSLAVYASEDVPTLADAIVETVTTVLPVYRRLLGPLPEATITVASAHLAGANGVSWPGMIWLDLTTLSRDGTLSDEERPGLRFTVAHEVGHQWIGGVLGLNSNDHGFMLEGLTNALAIGAVREAWGPDAAVEAMGRFVAGPYSGLVRDDRDVIADQPLRADTNVVLRALGVYGKAGLGFEAIRQAIGNDAWRAVFGAFAVTWRDAIFTPDDLRSALKAGASSPKVVDDLWAFWFEQERTTLADIDPIVQGAGS